MPDQVANSIEKIKRSRLRQTDGQEVIPQVQHIGEAGAQLCMGDAFVQGNVITADPSSAPVLVGAGNLLRIKVGATTYVTFGPDPTVAPLNAPITSSTSPAIMLDTSSNGGWWLVVAGDDFMAASANPTRIELVDAR